MTKYIIGIIDDDEDEIDTIERSIIVNLPKDIRVENVDFLAYSLDDNDRDPVDALTQQVIDDAANEEVSALLIDYKLVVNQQNIEGSEIFGKINKIIPKFPIIMLTNVAEGCYQKDCIDADKVYEKRGFFKVEGQYSKEKINHLFLNIKKYKRLRSELSVNLKQEMEKMAQNNYDSNSLQKVVDVETQLNDYIPGDENNVEKALNISDLKEIVSLIEKAKGLLGDKDED